MRKHSIVLIVVGMLLVATLRAGSCDSSDSGPAVGSGDKCIHQLSQEVTFDYLADHGLEPAGKQQTAKFALAGAIAHVCQQGPASQTVEDAKQRVVDAIEKRYSGG